MSIKISRRPLRDCWTNKAEMGQQSPSSVIVRLLILLLFFCYCYYYYYYYDDNDDGDDDNDDKDDGMMIKHKCKYMPPLQKELLQRFRKVFIAVLTRLG
jgi:hypothetical protein